MASFARFSFAFSPDSKTVVINDAGSSEVDIINLSQRAKTDTLYGHLKPVTTVAFSPDGQTIATGSIDKTIQIWDKDTAREIERLIGHKNAISSLTFNQNNEELISADVNGEIKFWHLKSKLPSKPNPEIQDDILILSQENIEKKLYLSVGELDSKITAWDTGVIQQESVFFEGKEPIKFLSYSPDGKYMAVANGKEITLLNSLFYKSSNLP